MAWILWAREAPEHIKGNRPGYIWIIHIITTVIRNGKWVDHTHYFLTSLSTEPKALLSLIRQP